MRKSKQHAYEHCILFNVNIPLHIQRPCKKVQYVLHTSIKFNVTLQVQFKESEPTIDLSSNPAYETQMKVSIIL